MTMFFGEKWDAPITEHGIQYPTPVGKPCLMCEKPVVEGDKGILVPSVDDNYKATIFPIHLLCMCMNIHGPVEPIKSCTCRPSTDLLAPVQPADCPRHSDA